MSPLPAYSDSSVALLNDLVRQRTGIYFAGDQQERLLEKLAPLMVEREIDSLMDYYYLLKYDGDSQTEWRRVASALAVNETYFWREYDQIQVCATILVPQILVAHPGRPVRIWHAACATGEEPYTMAIALAEAGVGDASRVEIIATDFNEKALAKAERAVYRSRSFRSIPPDIWERYFSPEGDDHWRLSDPIRSRVSFAHLNLVDPEGMAAMRGFDLIFCRNTFIYFSTPAIRQVAEHFYNALLSPGYLFIAAAESLLKVTTLFELDDVGGEFVYKK